MPPRGRATSCRRSTPLLHLLKIKLGLQYIKRHPDLMPNLRKLIALASHCPEL